jgi:hypothetical protein
MTGRPTMEDVAALLSKSASRPDPWIMDRLRNFARLISYRSPNKYDDAVERSCLDSARHLQEWLPMYAKAEELVAGEYPDFIDDATRALDELIPYLTAQIDLHRRGRPRDHHRHLCAAVCSGIWEELHGSPQPHSPRLWEACEAYWVACDGAETISGHIKNWEDFLTTP